MYCVCLSVLCLSESVLCLLVPVLCPTVCLCVCQSACLPACLPACVKNVVLTLDVFVEKTANSIQLQPGTFPESALSMSPSEEIKDTDMFTDGHDMHPSDCDGISDFATRKPQLTTHSLERPIRPSDTQFISGCEYITQHWKEIGWLMLSGSGYTMENIRRDIIKHFLHDPDSVKVIHLIEQWQILKRHRTTARELVDICCHPTVGGVRHQIENSLSYESSSYNGKQSMNQCS